MTLKFDVWPWKTTEHLFNATSSSVHHLVTIGVSKLELQSGNAQFGSKSSIFFSRVTLQFDVWPWKIIEHLFYATSSFVHHFVAIGDLKLELQSRNAQFGSNSTIFRAAWPWNLTDDLQNNRAPFISYFKLLCSILWPLVNSNWSYSPETPNLGHIRRFLELCDLEIWQMTFKNKRAPLLNIIKLYASFHHHTWILTGVTVQKR